MLHIDSRERSWIIVLSSVAAVTSLMLWGTKDAAFDEMILRSTLTLAIILYFPVIYAIRFVSIPPKINAVQRNEIEDLKKAAESSLELSLPKDEVHITKAHMDIRDGSKIVRIYGTIIRVRVKNKSAAKSIQDVRCVIPEIEGQDHAFTNQKLQPLAAEPSFQLAAGGQQIVSVMFVPDDTDIEEVFIAYDMRLEIGRGLPRRNHRLMVEAQGLDIAPSGRWLVVNLDNGIDAYLEQENG